MLESARATTDRSAEELLPLEAPELPEKLSESAVPDPSLRQRQSRFSPNSGFRRTLLILLLAVVAYVAYQRVGTRANVQDLQSFENLAGGFLAVGMTDVEPGVLILSRIEKAKVQIDATMSRNALSGDATTLSIITPTASRSWRLRSPLVVTIGTDGVISSASINWTAIDFREVADAVNCENASKHKHPRCGEPFDDLGDYLKQRSDNAPSLLAEFLQHDAEREAVDEPHPENRTPSTTPAVGNVLNRNNS